MHGGRIYSARQHHRSALSIDHLTLPLLGPVSPHGPAIFRFASSEFNIHICSILEHIYIFHEICSHERSLPLGRITHGEKNGFFSFLLITGLFFSLSLCAVDGSPEENG